MATIYGVIGLVVVAQFGTIVTLGIWLAKAIWWASRKETEVDRLKKDMNAAFIKLRLNGSDNNKNKG